MASGFPMLCKVLWLEAMQLPKPAVNDTSVAHDGFQGEKVNVVHLSSAFYTFTVI